MYRQHRTHLRTRTITWHCVFITQHKTQPHENRLECTNCDNI